MELAEKREYTIKDIHNLPEGERAELIDGQLMMMAPPSRKHQGFVMELSAAIRNHIHSNGGSCKVYPAPFAVFLNMDEKNYVEPDISVVCDRDKLNDKGCNGAPDWIIEVASPSSRTMDYYIKLGKYRLAGVREYWIVDAERGIVLVYNMEAGEAPVMCRFVDKIESRVMEGLEIDFASLDV